VLFLGGIETADGHFYLHVCRCEVNQNPVTKPGLKQRLVVMFGPQNSLRSHLTASEIQNSAYMC